MKKICFILLLCLMFISNAFGISSGNYTLKASGGDYTTLKDFFNALEPLTGDINLTVDSGTYSETTAPSAVTENLNGYTLTIQPATYPTKTDGTTGAIFNVNVGNLAMFIRMQMEGPGNVIIQGLNFIAVTTNPYMIRVDGVDASLNLIIRRNVFKGAYHAVSMADSDLTYNIYNNIFFNQTSTNDNVAAIAQPSGGSAMAGYVANNTIVDVTGSSNAYGVRLNGITYTGAYTNNLVYNSKSGDFYNVNAATGKNNSSYDATANNFGGAGSANNRINKTTSPFTNYATDDFTLLAASDPIGNGLDLSASFTTDFFGVTRSTWDIGACAYVAPTSTIKKYNGVAYASIKKIDGVAIANVK